MVIFTNSYSQKRCKGLETFSIIDIKILLLLLRSDHFT